MTVVQSVPFKKKITLVKKGKYLFCRKKKYKKVKAWNNEPGGYADVASTAVGGLCCHDKQNCVFIFLCLRCYRKLIFQAYFL